MNTISQQRCFNHTQREAVARCPECLRFFCRECITEHDSRVFCAQCLKRLTKGEQSVKVRHGGIIMITKTVAGFLCLWLLFYGLGRTLISIPSSFHEGTLWKNGAERITE